MNKKIFFILFLFALLKMCNGQVAFLLFYGAFISFLCDKRLCFSLDKLIKKH